MGDAGFLFEAAMNCMYPERSSTFNPTRVIKCFEPLTSATVLLVQRHSDNEKTILKLADCRLGYRGGHLPSKDSRPVHPRLFGVVRLRITPDSTLHPITGVVQGPTVLLLKFLDSRARRFPRRVLLHRTITTWWSQGERLSLSLNCQYIPGVSRTKLKAGVDVSMREAERISSQVMEALRAIEAENCILHNDILVGNVVLRDGSRSPVIIDFGQADIREPVLSDEEWKSVVWGSPEDTRRMRNHMVNPEDGPWKRTVTPYEMSDPHHKDPLVFNENVESMPEDFRKATFERGLETDRDGAREKMYQWRIRPGARCRPIYD
ncbi:hypothetical protein ARMGADRAFT_1033941 [Armillaria gallica]|uniref:Protein kinase domain-containing protein n=1 Tax=Armillaria gallica TaxID=47427 RepID=A0A2H3D016_ARMGA|nr:hypothetical protein ARMGADRAFT_1033941 [Armillaria gallica]